MYLGLNSMNGAMFSRSSSFVSPLIGGTISIDGYALLLVVRISDTFIFLVCQVTVCGSIVYCFMGCLNSGALKKSRC